jgi:solute carrier family 35 protein C2
MLYKFLFSRIWQCSTGTVVDPFTWSQFLILVFPIGITTAIDILFSNISLQYITITLYTITKTSVIAWTFFWALILKIEIFRLKTFVIVCFICLGIALAVASPTKISVWGLSFCLIASGAGGLRWAVTERLVKYNEQCKNPFVCLHHIAPVSAIFMVPIGLGIDFVPFLDSEFAQDHDISLWTFAIISIGGVMAFALILVEVKLVQLTSSLTMGVLGQLKELLQIILAIVIFKDEVSPINAMGLGLALACVGVYKWIKRTEYLEVMAKEGADNGQVFLII